MKDYKGVGIQNVIHLVLRLRGGDVAEPVDLSLLSVEMILFLLTSSQ